MNGETSAAERGAGAEVSRPPGQLTVAVVGVGLLGPGLENWAAARPLLCSPALWHLQATVVPAPGSLPANERRRAGTVVRASIVVAEEACLAAGLDAAQLATVFTSSTGDPSNCHLLCEALAKPERLVSPTRFTNSVHNAAAGYWHIAVASRQASTSLAAFDASFAAGLLEAAVQCLASSQPVLLVACDVPYPEPLHKVRPLLDVFAVALVLAPENLAERNAPLLRLHSSPAVEVSACQHSGLEALRLGIPAARALPLLQRLAQATACALVIEGLPGQALQLSLCWPQSAKGPSPP